MTGAFLCNVHTSYQRNFFVPTPLALFYMPASTLNRDEMLFVLHVSVYVYIFMALSGLRKARNF